jgi:hypothetical protein
MIDELLGLPRGSVRAGIALLMTAGLLVAPPYPGVPVEKWFSVLSNITLIVIGFYFGARINERRRQSQNE